MSPADINIIHDQNIAWKDLGDGVRRKIMFYNETWMMVKFEFQTGAKGALHQHPHAQNSYVASGQFEFYLGAEKRIISAGDVYNVPPNTEHGILCLEAGTLVDVFSPIREDFL
jgi:quercetin dioxygenase-like cupin family protein